MESQTTDNNNLEIIKRQDFLIIRPTMTLAE